MAENMRARKTFQQVDGLISVIDHARNAAERREAIIPAVRRNAAERRVAIIPAVRKCVGA